MMEHLDIPPFRRALAGQTVALPGSKSLTNRALLLAALCDGQTTLRGALFSRDTRIMTAALRKLGFRVEEREAEREITVGGLGGRIPSAEASIHVGNAGTAARFITALLACRRGGGFTLDGDEAMRGRPMRGLLESLESNNAATFEFHGERWRFPFTMRTAGLRAGELEVDPSASSQILSALLMVAPTATPSGGVDTLTLKFSEVRQAFVQMTIGIMRQFGFDGVAETAEGMEVAVGASPCSLPSGRYEVEPDATAASYFIALPLVVGGGLRIEGLKWRDSLQGDLAFADVMRGFGLRHREAEDGVVFDYGGGIEGGPLATSFNSFSDTFLTLAALAPLLNRRVRIEGIAHTRKQETDRVAGMARELAKLVGPERVTEEEDALEIDSDPRRFRNRVSAKVEREGPIEIETYEDHRFAMSFGILGCFDLLGDGRPWLRLKDPLCCGKTFPDFFDRLAALRANGEESAVKA